MYYAFFTMACYMRRQAAHITPVLAIGLLISISAYSFSIPSASAAAGEGELFMVDCLLPGQIRKLGRRAVFQTARRPIKTTARDCEIRGGEYVSYDRSNYATALKVWLPQAKEGDKVAQTYVGEIFEKGLGVGSDYILAASWYRKASEQGYAPAQINLGFLYEKGLGIEKDPVKALNLYRMASGLSDAIVLDTGGADTGMRRELEELRGEVERRKKESEELRKQLEKTRKELKDRTGEVGAEKTKVERARIELEKRKSEAAGSYEEVKALERELKHREAALQSQREEMKRLQNKVVELESDTEIQRDRLAERKEGKQEAEYLKRQLEKTKREMENRTGEVEAEKIKVKNVLIELERRKSEADGSYEEVKALEQGLKQREAALKSQRQEIKQLQNKVAQLESRAELRSKELAKLNESKVSKAGPVIEMIEPQLRVMRGIIPSVRTKPGVERVIVGRVSAPAGLLTFTFNDREVKPDERGLFRVKTSVKRSGVPVKLVAVDKRGKRTTVEFLLTPDATEKASPAKKKKASPAADFGDYYALIIGNRQYAHWPRLETPKNDAVETASILKKKYGFKTKVLLDATRRDILQTLNEYRKKLTEKDNLLIYYAGHGHLDKKIGRGYWVPVDGETDSPVLWIPTFAVTDFLGGMSAKHVLVVADSCYSGVLTRSSIARLQAGMSKEARDHWLQVMSKKRSRTVLTSGDLQPVLDMGGGGHSVFANAFLDVLRKNDEVLEGQRLHNLVSARVAYAADVLKVEQIPQYAPIRFAGHESGDFLFVPRN